MSEATTENLRGKRASQESRTYGQTLKRNMLRAMSGFAVLGAGVGFLIGWMELDKDTVELKDAQAQATAFRSQANITRGMIDTTETSLGEGCKVELMTYVKGLKKDVEDIAAIEQLASTGVCSSQEVVVLLRERRDYRDLAFNEVNAQFHERQLPNLQADAENYNELWHFALGGAAVGLAVGGMFSSP